MEEIGPSAEQQGDISVENTIVISHAISESPGLKDDCVNKANVFDKSTDDDFKHNNIESECQNSSKPDDEGLPCDGDQISSDPPNPGHNGQRDVSENLASPAPADSQVAHADGDSEPAPSEPTAEKEATPPPVAMETSDAKEPDAEKLASGAVDSSSGEPSNSEALPDDPVGKVGPNGDGGASGQDTTATETHVKQHTDLGKASEAAMETEAAGTSEETKDGGESKADTMEMDSQKEEEPGVSVTEGATAATSTSLCSEKAPIQSVYHVKWIKFKGETLPIVTQNENGPCPLLAIMNVLLLQQRVRFPAMIEMVTSGQLLDYLGDCILEHAPKNISEDTRLNYEQNMHDAMAVFHKLQTGLDVNVKFTGISDFEYTPECIVFDLLSIQLYHGWLVDPESPETVAALGTCSYNQLVEKIIEQKNHKREELMHEALMAEEFLERTASQLTYHGLHELVTTLKEDELAVFFRNNHFSTLLKHKNELFHLVTDQGFLTESNVVWETLSNVEGDGNFVDMDFRTFTKPEAILEPLVPPVVPANTDQQIDQDYLVALSLQQEQNSVAQAEESRQSQTQSQSQSQSQSQATQQPQATLSDHDLALRLQEEENRAAREHQQRAAARQAQQPRPAAQPRKKSSDCVII